MKKQLAAVLAVTMALGMSSGAFAAVPDAKGEITLPGQVASPILNYAVPTAVPFTIDAFNKMDGTNTGSQIYSPYFTILNKSDVAVSVKVKPALVPKTDAGVIIKESAGAVNSDDYTNAAKELYVETVVAEPGSIADDASNSTAAVTVGAVAGATIAENKAAMTTAPAFTEATTGPATAAKFVVDFSGTELATAGAVEMVLVGTKAESPTVTIVAPSAVVEEANIASPAKIAEAFKGKEFKFGGKTFTVDASTGVTDKVATFTAGDTTALGTLAGYTFTGSIRAPEGVAANPAKTVTDFATAFFKPATGADTTGKVITTTKTPSMLFALNKGTYVKAHSEAEESTVFSALHAEGATALRLMGKVNPVAAWAADDLSIMLKYEINPMSGEMYNNATAEKGSALLGGAGLFRIPPTTGTVDGTAATTEGAELTKAISGYWNGGQTALEIPVTLYDGEGVAADKVTINTVQYRVGYESTTGAMLSSTVKTLDENGKLIITPANANLPNIKTKGALVVITFSDGKKVTMKLTI